MAKPIKPCIFSGSCYFPTHMSATPENTQPQPSLAATEKMKMMRAHDPEVFASVDDLVAWQIGVQMGWGESVYHSLVVSPIDYPAFQSPLLAFNGDSYDFGKIVAQTMADKMPESAISNGEDSMGFDSESLTTEFQIGVLVFHSVIDCVNMGGIEMETKKTAMKAAKIDVPTCEDPDKFDEKIDDGVTFYSINISCSIVERSEPQSKKQKN